MNTGRATNPFSSHLVEPARGGFHFTPVQQFSGLEQLMDLLERHHWRGELVGHEGVGKSTLLTDICTNLLARQLRVVRWQCNDQQRTLPRGWRRDIQQCDVIAIDGAERLWPWLLWMIRLQTHTAGKGLIITTHQPKGLGAYLPVRPDPVALAHKISGLTGIPAEPNEIEPRLKQHNGNAREVLFDFYMEYEK